MHRWNNPSVENSTIFVSETRIEHFVSKKFLRGEPQRCLKNEDFFSAKNDRLSLWGVTNIFYCTFFSIFQEDQATRFKILAPFFQNLNLKKKILVKVNSKSLKTTTTDSLNLRVLKIIYQRELNVLHFWYINFFLNLMYDSMGNNV